MNLSLLEKVITGAQDFVTLAPPVLDPIFVAYEEAEGKIIDSASSASRIFSRHSYQQLVESTKANIARGRTSGQRIGSGNRAGTYVEVGEVICPFTRQVILPKNVSDADEWFKIIIYLADYANQTAPKAILQDFIDEVVALDASVIEVGERLCKDWGEGRVKFSDLQHQLLKKIGVPGSLSKDKGKEKSDEFDIAQDERLARELAESSGVPQDFTFFSRPKKVIPDTSQDEALAKSLAKAWGEEAPLLFSTGPSSSRITGNLREETADHGAEVRLAQVQDELESLETLYEVMKDCEPHDAEIVLGRITELKDNIIASLLSEETHTLTTALIS